MNRLGLFGILILCFIGKINICSGQKTTQSILQSHFGKNNLLVKKTKSYYHFEKKWQYYNPISYIGATLILVYQKVISKQIQADCVYQISCSEFTRLCIQKYGLVKGSLMGLNQLSECYPNVYLEHARNIERDSKIINKLDE
jgi:putative component of membrane protein insertase Oxa1/YidC/SpoIIIJ protein YidD